MQICTTTGWKDTSNSGQRTTGVASFDDGRRVSVHALPRVARTDRNRCHSNQCREFVYSNPPTIELTFGVHSISSPSIQVHHDSSTFCHKSLIVT
eukprot:m.1321970 g.1321970  ORF g.1321970 m.1321970 type:complete len:95 (-) comp24848_c1_seq14:7049-7333(-)